MSTGGDKKTTTTAASGPPAWAEPYFKNLLNRANTVTSQPYVGYDGPRIADFSGDQLAGFDQVRQLAGQGQPGLDAANQHLQSSLQGGGTFDAQANPYMGAQNPYAGQNQYLNQMVGDAQADVTNAYNTSVAPGISSAFSAGGAYGGSAHQQAAAESQRQLAGELGRVSTNLRSADYDRQAQLAESGLNRNAGLAGDLLNRQQSAWAANQQNKFNAVDRVGALNSAKYDDARALMNIGQQQQNLYQGLYDQGYEDFQDWRNYDQNQLGVLANALGSIQGGSSSQTGANPNYRSSGQNVAGYAALLASLWG